MGVGASAIGQGPARRRRAEAIHHLSAPPRVDSLAPPGVQGEVHWSRSANRAAPFVALLAAESRGPIAQRRRPFIGITPLYGTRAIGSQAATLRSTAASKAGRRASWQYGVTRGNGYA